MANRGSQSAVILFSDTRFGRKATLHTPPALEIAVGLVETVQYECAAETPNIHHWVRTDLSEDRESIVAADIREP